MENSSLLGPHSSSAKEIFSPAEKIIASPSHGFYLPRHLIGIAFALPHASDVAHQSRVGRTEARSRRTMRRSFQRRNTSRPGPDDANRFRLQSEARPERTTLDGGCDAVASRGRPSQ